MCCDYPRVTANWTSIFIKFVTSESFISMEKSAGNTKLRRWETVLKPINDITLRFLLSYGNEYVKWLSQSWSDCCLGAAGILWVLENSRATQPCWKDFLTCLCEANQTPIPYIPRVHITGLNSKCPNIKFLSKRKNRDISSFGG